MNEFTGRVALVTGGGSGIGRAIALRYAAGGGTVAVLGRRAEPLRETARLAEERGAAADVIICDVRDPAAVTAAVDGLVARHGRLDALVNNAAGNFVCPAEDLSPNGWKAVIDIVLNGGFHCTRAAAQHMLAAGRGSILNVIATYAWHGHPGTVHSAAAKAGVLAMTRSLAVEWGGRGIRVNCIAPGPTEAGARHRPRRAVHHAGGDRGVGGVPARRRARGLRQRRGPHRRRRPVAGQGGLRGLLAGRLGEELT
ncbi:SDR family NAD(P)-dependent oxidoreductase [Pseudonocardia nigra]|uniref:SDR family NAD(P)-dependent oxidoreductase n=1 Tax=Pseudonocardia nigra TaxID=1921578 RepID=UPI001C5D5687|nr:SDR family NAD(P)-dependent oxidoreductase [Pseudonocardia nigra]